MRAWDDLFQRLQRQFSLEEASAMISIMERRLHHGTTATEIPPALQQLVEDVLTSKIQGNKVAYIESVLVQTALKLQGGNKSAAARLLGIERKAVERRILREGPEVPSIPPPPLLPSESKPAPGLAKAKIVEHHHQKKRARA